MQFKEVLGVDFGGSGIKAAPVHTKTGRLLAPRHRLPTPDPATPEAVADVLKELVNHFEWKGAVGVGFPTVVLNGVIKTAANIDKSWIGINAKKLFTERLSLPVHIINDADSAGIAEMKFGAGKGKKGSVLLITVGTGIGTALFTKGKLLANTELGHIYLKNGMDAELFAADSVRQNEDLGWKEWAKRFNEYLLEMERLFWPELIIIGGGISKKKDKYIDYLTVKADIVMAKQKNEAGIIGAACAAKIYLKK